MTMDANENISLPNINVFKELNTKVKDLFFGSINKLSLIF